MADLAALAQLQAAAGLAQAWAGIPGAFGLAAQMPTARSTAAAPTGSELPAGQTLNGSVKAWMEEKGYGFVTPVGGGPDVFVHRNQLTDGQSLVVGGQVSFECRFNPARSKYEATSCSGAVSAGTAAVAAANAAAGKETTSEAASAIKAAGMTQETQDNLFVAGFPLGTAEDQVRTIFSQYGAITQCKILPDQPGKPDRAALVRFADPAHAKWVVENMNGNIPVGMTQPLRVTYAGDRTGLKGGSSATFGKAQTMVLDNRYSPYGAVAGMAGIMHPSLAAYQNQALAAALGQDPTAAAIAAATGAPQLDQASLAAALAQIMQHQQQQVPLTIPGLAAVPGLGAISAGQALDPATAQGQLLLGQPGLDNLTGLLTGTTPSALTVQASAGAGAVSAAPDANALAAAVASAVGATPGLSITTAQAAVDPAQAATATADSSATPAQQTTAPASGEWLEALDPASGKPYYYHSITRETRWDKPAA